MGKGNHRHYMKGVTDIIQRSKNLNEDLTVHGTTTNNDMVTETDNDLKMNKDFSLTKTYEKTGENVMSSTTLMAAMSNQPNLFGATYGDKGTLSPKGSSQPTSDDRRSNYMKSKPSI